jgi:RNA polymerase sigma factor (sigma-70 family)
MPPPPAEQIASRIFLGPALRAQSDRRLVRLVREGYEAAFEEIVRRYRKPLDRFAAAIVGGSSEDVTQDAFSKALLALRGSEAEIELRPWLYRIVRNTALNDLRDGPPAAEQLGETLEGGRSAAAEAERREEIADLMGRLRALPEPQRAAIVMRELEGLSHAEIAAALGVSGGAARQTIHRARVALRDGLGMLIPLPLLRLLFDHGAEAAGAGGAVAAAGAAGAAGASGGAGAMLGGAGAGGALKIGLATVLVAGSVGAGVAVEQRHERSGGPSGTEAAVAGEGADLKRSAAPVRFAEPRPELADAAARRQADDRGRHDGEDGPPHRDDAGTNNGPSLTPSFADSGSGPGPSPQGPAHDGHGSGHGGPGPSGGREASGAGSGRGSGGGDGSGSGGSSGHGSGGGGGSDPSASSGGGPGGRQAGGEDHSGSSGHSGGGIGSGGGGGAEGERGGSGSGGGSSSGGPPQAPPPPPEEVFDDSSHGDGD